MTEVTIVGLDLAKRVFQVHGATANGSVAIRKKLSRGQVLDFSQICRPAWLLWRPVPQPIIGRVR